MAGIGVPAQAVLVPWTMLGCSEGSGTTISKLTPASAAVYSEPAGAPDVTGKVPSLGWPLRTNRMNWMGDFLDLSKIPRPVPFFWYHDAAKGIVAPVQNGKPVQHYVPLDPWGSPGITYHTTPILRNGRIERYDPRHGDVLFADEALYTAKGNIVSREGIRGECYLAPYVTWVAHPTLDPAGNPIPRSPFAIGVSVDGVIYAEYIWLEAKSLRLGKVQNVNGCLDLAFFPPNRKIFFVTDQSRAGRGRIIRVDRTPAIGSTRNSGTEDGAPWKQSDLVSGVGNITSLVCTDDGMLYATDNTNGAILKITAEGVTTTLARTPRAYWIRRTRDERLVVLSQDSSIRLYARDGSMLQLIKPAETGLFLFAALDVDRFGTCGEVDRILFFSSHMAEAHGCLFLDGPNWSRQRQWGDITWGLSTRCVGSIEYSGAPMHYPWGGFFHIDQGAAVSRLRIAGARAPGAAAAEQARGVLR